MVEVTIADVLDRAADLIEPEGAWTQGVLGRDARGRILMRNELKKAVCFCAQGALEMANGLQERSPHEAMRVFRSVIGKKEIGYWNDRKNRTQKAVVSKLREAATIARSTPPTGEGQ